MTPRMRYDVLSRFVPRLSNWGMIGFIPCVSLLDRECHRAGLRWFVVALLRGAGRPKST